MPDFVANHLLELLAPLLSYPPSSGVSYCRGQAASACLSGRQGGRIRWGMIFVTKDNIFEGKVNFNQRIQGVLRFQILECGRYDRPYRGGFWIQFRNPQSFD
jgi:hypothetical protein